MDQPPATGPWRTRTPLIVRGFLLVALLACGGFYYFRLRAVPPPLEVKLQRAPVEARLQLTPQASNLPRSNTQADQPAPRQTSPEDPLFHTTLDPMADFRQDLDTALLHDLAPAYPELQSVLGVQTSKSNDPAYRRVLFQLLDNAEKSSPAQRPAIFLAADFVAQEIWCAMENKADCHQLRTDLARYHLTLQGAGLGGVFIYPHDLLWRLWRDYPSTDWGERAFVILLEYGWDTSGTCMKGADQFREVIRQGESFLAQHPASTYRPQVTFLVAQAYEAWWSLSRVADGQDDYIDPKPYRQGADDARVKAIALYERVVQMTPQTRLGDYARQSIPLLQERQDTDQHKFFCVYD